jgi:hypothetical protein
VVEMAAGVNPLEIQRFQFQSLVCGQGVSQRSCHQPSRIQPTVRDDSPD